MGMTCLLSWMLLLQAEPGAAQGDPSPLDPPDSGRVWKLKRIDRAANRDFAALQQAFKTCQKIEDRLKTQNLGQERDLGEALKDIDAVINLGTPRYECLVTVEERSNETEEYNYFPYQFRGRLLLLKAHRGAASRAQKIEDLQKAQYDLTLSSKLYHCSSSRTYLAEVQKELASLEAAQHWQDEWTAIRERISLERWDGSDASLFAQVGKLLSMGSQAADPGELGEALAWIRAQAGIAGREAGALRGKVPVAEADRNAAARLSRWCAFMTPLAEYEPLRPLAPTLQEIREGLARLADYRGQMNLRVWVWRAGKVEKLSIDGKEIALPRNETPLVLKEPLGVGRLVILASEEPGKTVRIDLGPELFKDGGSYLLTIDASSESHHLTLLSPK